MNFEPQKFFIGLMDFFSILLPGALLAYLLKDETRLQSLGHRPVGTEGWIVFAVSAYLLGHFIFLLGAWLLDDYLYDPIRTATYAGKIGRLADGKKLPWRLTAHLAQGFIKKDADKAVRQAVRIEEQYLDPGKASSAINAFQWCKARLTIEHAEALATVQRFEADSKFFRSLCIILCFFVPWELVARRPFVALAGVVLLILAFWRYVDQRVKSTNQAYWYIITLESQREGGFRQPQPNPPGPTHAGGVVFRNDSSQVEYLLVQAKDAPEEWVLPKGHIEPGEKMKETAVREVREETGVWARVTDKLGDISYDVNGKPIKVQFFLMEALEEGEPADRGREHAWLPPDKAIDRASYDQSQTLLKLAEKARQAK